MLMNVIMIIRLGLWFEINVIVKGGGGIGRYKLIVLSGKLNKMIVWGIWYDMWLFCKNYIKIY